MNLEHLVDLLDKTPVLVNMHPVARCFLPEDIMIYTSLEELLQVLDSPECTSAHRMLVVDPGVPRHHRFPFVRCEHDPFTPELNNVLYSQFDFIEQHMLTQRDIAGVIASAASDYDVVVLFLVDGLSYRDLCRPGTGLRPWTVEPCLVNGPTKTSTGFRNLVGDPPLAARLFDMGFHRRLGLTHWYREDNVLADYLFRGIAQTQKVGHFSQVLATMEEWLTTTERPKGYVQILLTGLDGYAHGQKRKPPVNDIVDDVLEEFMRLAKLLEEVGVAARLWLSADHGILWRDEFEPEVIGAAPGKVNPRCAEWSALYCQREPGRRFNLYGEEVYCLNYPKVRRPLHIDDQGIHGGISFQESIVPFVTMEIIPDD